MPALDPNANALVLVSGANGFCASHIIQQLLQRGYRARGTVRSEAKIPHLKQTFAEFGDAFECVVVADVTKDGAFNEAVKDVDAIIHTASPIAFSFDDPEEAIGPAVKGTVGIMKSALTICTDVKRIVFTSSVVALHPPHNGEPPAVFTETDINDVSARVIEEKGRDASVMDKYFASKALADKAAWELYRENKDRIKWDFVSIHPSTVLGPIIHEASDTQTLNATSWLFWMEVVTGAIPPMNEQNWIDVRDVALMHILALEKPEAAGEKIIASASTFKWQDFLDAANAIDPPPYPNMPKGTPGVGYLPDVVHPIQYDTSKAARVLGMGANIKYRTKEETTRDTLLSFKARGFQP